MPRAEENEEDNESELERMSHHEEQKGTGQYENEGAGTSKEVPKMRATRGSSKRANTASPAKKPTPEKPVETKDRRSSSEGMTMAAKKEATSKPKKRKAADKSPPEIKKNSKKRRKDSGTSSTASLSSDTEETETSSSESSSTSPLPSSDEGTRSSKKKGGKKTVDMDLLEELWATEDRLKKLQSRAGLRGYTIPKLMKLKEQFVKETEKKGLGTSIYGKDKKPKSRRYKGMKDDGELKLPPARFTSLPVSEPAKYWDKVPTCMNDVFRHIPLQHLGVKNVPESTIVKMHNRKAPVELSMMRKEVTEIRHVQEAVFNYVAILRSLHPMDHAGLAIQKTLIDTDWCRHVGPDDKQRVGIMKSFFDDTVRENSGRAVRKEPPLDAEQVTVLLNNYILKVIAGSGYIYILCYSQK